MKETNRGLISLASLIGAIFLIITFSVIAFIALPTAMETTAQNQLKGDYTYDIGSSSATFQAVSMENADHIKIVTPDDATVEDPTLTIGQRTQVRGLEQGDTIEIYLVKDGRTQFIASHTV